MYLHQNAPHFHVGKKKGYSNIKGAVLQCECDSFTKDLLYNSFLTREVSETNAKSVFMLPSPYHRLINRTCAMMNLALTALFQRLMHYSYNKPVIINLP